MLVAGFNCFGELTQTAWKIAVRSPGTRVARETVGSVRDISSSGFFWNSRHNQVLECCSGRGGLLRSGHYLCTSSVAYNRIWYKASLFFILHQYPELLFFRGKITFAGMKKPVAGAVYRRFWPLVDNRTDHYVYTCVDFPFDNTLPSLPYYTGNCCNVLSALSFWTAGIRLRGGCGEISLPFLQDIVRLNMNAINRPKMLFDCSSK